MPADPPPATPGDDDLAAMQAEYGRALPWIAAPWDAWFPRLFALAHEALASRAEIAGLLARCKPAEPPYLPCPWHAGTDDTCSWCLRHRLAEEEELRRQQHRAHHTVMDSQQREIVALRAELARRDAGREQGS
jgi:hypothetical protein